MLIRAVRAALLNGWMYRALTDEPEEIFYALGIVVLSGLALGAGIYSLVTLGENVESIAQAGSQAPLLPNWQGAPLWLFVMYAVWARLVTWFLWAGIAYAIGTKAFGGQAGYRRLLRSIGLAFGPGVLALFAGIPFVGPILMGLSFLWIFPASMVAIRETQQINWVQATICAILGWMASIALLIVIFQFTRVNA